MRRRNFIAFLGSAADSRANDDKRGHHEDGSAAGLVQAGQVRVGLFASFLYTKNPATGELRGVGIEIARALAARLGVEVLIVERSDPAEIVECLKAGACDVALLG